LFFHCERIGGELLTTGAETSGAKFFPEAALPELSLSRVTPAQIHRCFEHLRQPLLRSDFD
jgi:hypothetical protein